MWRIALRSLAHDRAKLAASLAGVAFAATLVLAQIGLYAGFLGTSCEVIRKAGGDLWIMARGTQVLERSEPLSAGSRDLVAAHRCVVRARALLFASAMLRKAGGGLDTVQLIGFEPARGQGEPASLVFPWSLRRGLPQDLHAPSRVAVDAGDLGKLQITGDPVGTSLELGGQSVFVAAVTEGVRSFTLLPFMFAEIDTARRLAGLGEGQANYWIVDLADPGCARDVAETIEREHPDLQVRTTAEYRAMTQDYWVKGTGAGTALAFSALLGLVVGTVIVGQTLYALTKEHLRELGTLKAIGATNGELIGFVAWQAAFLAVVGGGLGGLLALGIQQAIGTMGLVVELSPEVLSVGALAVTGMCAVASLGSVRKVVTLEAAEVFK